jgi:hypothetical protein
MKLLSTAIVIALLVPVAVTARESHPADSLHGRIIISDRKLPNSWSSVGSYVSQVKNLSKGTLWYDKKTGKLTLEYAAFFAKELADVQVNLVIYDITNGARDHRGTWEQFLPPRARMLINSITLDKEDFEMNKKYRLVIVDRGTVLASGDVIIRGEGPHYSGKVEFTDEEAKKKD